MTERSNVSRTDKVKQGYGLCITVKSLLWFRQGRLQTGWQSGPLPCSLSPGFARPSRDPKRCISDDVDLPFLSLLQPGIAETCILVASGSDDRIECCQEPSDVWRRNVLPASPNRISRQELRMKIQWVSINIEFQQHAIKLPISTP